MGSVPAFEDGVGDGRAGGGSTGPNTWELLVWDEKFFW